MNVFLWVFVGLVVAGAAVGFLGEWRKWWALQQWQRIVLACLLVFSAIAGVGIRAHQDDLAEPVFDDTFPAVTRNTPFRVQLAPELVEYAPAIRTTLKAWNDAVGCPVFVEAPEGQEYDVRYVFGGTVCDSGQIYQLPDPDAMAGVAFCGDGSVDIEVQRVDELWAAGRAFMHEEGHVLRLAHDPTGIMARHVDPNALLVPSDKDAKALYARYCR